MHEPAVAASGQVSCACFCCQWPAWPPLTHVPPPSHSSKPDPSLLSNTVVTLLYRQVTDSVVSYAVKNYVGVLQLIHPDPQEPFYKKTVSRLVLVSHVLPCRD